MTVPVTGTRSGRPGSTTMSAAPFSVVSRSRDSITNQRRALVGRPLLLGAVVAGLVEADGLHVVGRVVQDDVAHDRERTPLLGHHHAPGAAVWSTWWSAAVWSAEARPRR